MRSRAALSISGAGEEQGGSARLLSTSRAFINAARHEDEESIQAAHVEKRISRSREAAQIILLPQSWPH